ncbi:MAG TPA: YncE family protein [Bryobacteraceae bacterium]|nr:YncE family protein [Bryobacteraceae bacterium]
MTRRALLLGSVAAIGCARRRGRGFPGYAFIANAGAHTISAVDLSTFALARQIGMDSAPASVLSSTLRPAAFVLLPESGSVCEIDAVKLAMVRKTRLGGPAISMRPAADGKSLWVLQPQALVRLEGARLRAVESIPLPGVAGDFDLTTDGRAGVTFQSERRLALVRLQNGAIEHLIDAGCEPSLVRFQSDGKQVVIGSRADRSLTIFDTAGRTVVKLPLPVEPANCCFDPAGGQMFVTGPGMDVVVIVYPYQTEVGETILAGRAPDGLAVSATPPYLFVANPDSGSVTVLDIDTRKLVAVVSVGQEPRHILITPDNRYALVLNVKSGNMAVVRIAAFRERRHRTDPPPLFTMVPVGARPVGGAIVEVS